MSKGLASVKTLTAKEIAKKWNLPLSVVSKKIAAGVKVEKEHTKSTRQANEIARDHLGERPDYYDKLGQMEKKKIVKENTSVTGVAGLGFNTGVPAVDDDNEYVTTNALANDPQNGAVLDLVAKSHQSLHNRLGFKEFNPKKLKMSSNKDLAESLGSDYGTAAVPVVGDLSGSSRKVAKIDEINLKKFTNKIPPKVKSRIRSGLAGAALASNAAAGAISFQNASTGQGSPSSDIVSSAAGLPGKVGYAFFAGKSAKAGFDTAKEHLKAKEQANKKPQQAKNVKEGKGVVPTETTERGIYEGDPMKDAEEKIKAAFTADKVKSMFKRVDKERDKDPKWVAYKKRKQMKEEQIDEMSPAMGAGASMARFLTPPRLVVGLLGDKVSGESDRDKEIKDLETNINHQRKLDSIKNLNDWPHSENPAVMSEISAELVGKVSNARFWQGKAPSKTLTRAINKKFIESGKKKEDKKEKVKEAWTPFFPPHHKHSARLSKEKSNKPDVIMDPGAGGTTKTIYEVKQMDTKELINEALDNILENNLVDMKENLMTALQEKAMEKIEERKKIIAANYFAE